jgi:hypothetical protein
MNHQFSVGNRHNPRVGASRLWLSAVTATILLEFREESQGFLLSMIPKWSFPFPEEVDGTNVRFQQPQRGAAYQPRVQPWELGFIGFRVLKERCITWIRPSAPDRCGVPSEREFHGIAYPGVLPRAGMRCPVGAGIQQPRRGEAYQPRVQPWEFGSVGFCVLKERWITWCRTSAPDP